MSTADLSLDPRLPIAGHQGQIAELIQGHQVVIVAGETGSGKSTQLPKICLGLGRKSIGHTQPRRIAARSVASRIAEEIGTPLGEDVGYQVRFTATTSAATRLKVMTDGILLAEIGHDRALRKYDTIIIDEAHERSLNIDFLLGYLKQLLPKRPDLKVVITSATIDTERFAAHFDDAPVVEVSGRMYPVEVRYAPLGLDDDPVQAIVDAVRTLPKQGDVLVFCSGEREIKDAAKAISGARLGVEVLPLFARLTMEEQARVFAPHPGQRVVLATNVAETSLTVPGIRYVVDPGFARISRYSARTKVQRLPIEAISQASANQRAGRCGRVAPGICVRLYSEEDFESRSAYTEPEILRTNLASVILAMANARLGEIADFPFVQAPDRTHIADGLRLLTELGAITVQGTAPRLTNIGRQLANLPIDPRLGRMLLEGAKRDCLRETLVIVAGLSIQDVRERPQEQRGQADALHARFASDTVLGATTEPPNQAANSQPTPAQTAQPSGPARITPHTGWKTRPDKVSQGGLSPVTQVDAGGDFAALLRLWAYLKAKRKELSSSQFRRLCHSEYLNYLRVREWQDLVTQLREVCKQLHLPMNHAPAKMDDVLTACLAGLLSNIGALDLGSKPQDGKGRRRSPRLYNGTRGASFAISPGSVLATTPPELVMAVELVETTRLWAHTVAAISPTQVEQVGSHMLQHSYSEPFFAASTGTVLAHEKVSLLGVPLIADRRVGYAAIDPDQARQVFIQSGLVEGQANPRPGSPYARVADHNSTLRAHLEELEDKARRRGTLVDDTEVAAFFDARIPPTICSLADLDRWLKADPSHVVALQMTEEDLIGREPEVSDDDFPDSWTFGPSSFGLDYRFTPGGDRDGVTVTVPLASLSALDPAPFSWGVPGSRQELATELIRSLPKPVRTRFVPAPDWAKRALDWLVDNNPDHGKPFTDELGRALQALSGDSVGGWNPEALPEHLKMGFLVQGGGKATFGRDLAALQADLGRQVRQKLAQASPRQRATGVTWVFGTLPETVSIREHGLKVVGYPALKDQVKDVAETLLARLEEAQTTHLHGLARLTELALPEPYKWLVAHMSNPEKLALGTSPYPSVPALLADARIAAITDLVARRQPWQVRDQPSFEALVAQVRPDQVDATQALVRLAAESLQVLARVRPLLDGFDPKLDLAVDVSSQVRNLVFDGFLHVIPPRWLARVPVWLKAVEIRLTAARNDPHRDQSRLAQLDEVLEPYEQLLDAHPTPTEQIDHIGYLIEELRVQIFAQTLRTAETVSAKRIRKAIAEVNL